MNRKLIYIISFICMNFIACDNLPDEQFEKYVLITHNGFVDKELIYNSSKELNTEVSVSISGTSVLKQDVNVSIDTDAEALQKYNFEKYRNDEALYYNILPDGAYSFEKNITVKAGKEYSTVPIKLDLTSIDMFKNYVLPISIKTTSDYNLSPGGYHTTLLNLIFKNSFSGNYSINGTLKGTSESLSLSIRRILKVIDSNTCFAYMGNIDEEDLDRDKYIFTIKINEDKTLTLTGMNPETKFTPVESDWGEEKKNVMEITETEIRLYLTYSYIDSQDSVKPVKKTFTGYLSLASSEKEDSETTE